ncbi:MAG TPA: DNA helicase RecQ [Saprospiraceae bacterium]|nr:DNA helicase RecQ [Saprospiraceae bacterium]
MISEKDKLGLALKRYFGFDQFKENQEAIIKNLLSGRDSFVLMPTGGGKSLCYQLPALMSPGTAIVISPLIALMKNQVDAIRRHGDNDSVAHFLNSSLNKGQIRKVKEDILEGATKLLYVAPETLLKEENIDFFKSVNISFIAVDEAHCISEWGHDFRPEYRRIQHLTEQLEHEVSIIALTATATPKVRSDIIKNLGLQDCNTYVSSFNRPNLYYEVRPKKSKEKAVVEIIKFIKQRKGKSGIIYVQSRKSTEDIARQLSVNGILAAPYHAGLDAKTRAKTQDDFLMENIHVICATIAFGMGIDKPDVRFVIHYDIPKSIENYYQETGRAGRDGLEGDCLAFYSFKDLLKLEKFLRDKPVSERQMGLEILREVMSYAESSVCRRVLLLHYFGEDFDKENCGEMCDNCRHPGEQVQAKDEMVLALKVIQALQENYTSRPLVDFITGESNEKLKAFKLQEHPMFGAGKEKPSIFWKSLMRQALLHNYCRKDIEEYGILRLTEKGKNFIENPKPTVIMIKRDLSQSDEESDAPVSNEKTGVMDQILYGILQDIRGKIAASEEIPKYVVFQDPSLKEMCIYYPVSLEDMANISGVGMSKARRYGAPFIEAIQQYVDENNIERPNDIVIKSVANKSKSKIHIIQGIDRKMSLDDIASSIHVSEDELIDELGAIVLSGTKVDINYYIDDVVDEYSKEDIYDYFMEAESDSVESAFEELQEDDITMQEIKLVRIKFLSEMAN